MHGAIYRKCLFRVIIRYQKRLYRSLRDYTTLCLWPLSIHDQFLNVFLGFALVLQFKINIQIWGDFSTLASCIMKIYINSSIFCSNIGAFFLLFAARDWTIKFIDCPLKLNQQLKLKFDSNLNTRTIFVCTFLLFCARLFCSHVINTNDKLIIWKIILVQRYCISSQKMKEKRLKYEQIIHLYHDADVGNIFVSHKNESNYVNITDEFDVLTWLHGESNRTKFDLGTMISIVSISTFESYFLYLSIEMKAECDNTFMWFILLQCDNKRWRRSWML